jgi:hypothetical protein
MHALEYSIRAIRLLLLFSHKSFVQTPVEILRDGAIRPKAN